MTADEESFREVLGQYPTGVVAVTALVDGEPRGMILGTFNSVSLDPPLVSFMPSKASTSWGHLQQERDYCINVIGSEQEEVCRVLSSKRADKFTDVAWHATDAGHVRLDGAVAYIECRRHDPIDMGDHHIVVAEVTGLAYGRPQVPLLFFQGGFGSFRPLSVAAVDMDLAASLRSVNAVRPLMDTLADEFDTEVTAVVLHEDQLVLAAASGSAQTASFPSRVGVRLPFIAPLGGVFAAWGSADVRDAWATTSRAPQSSAEACGRIKARGYAIGLGHERSERWERLGYEVSVGSAPEESLRRHIADVSADYNVELHDDAEPLEFRFAQAPVFAPDGTIALALTLWGPRGTVRLTEMQRWAGRLVDVAAAAGRALPGA